MADVVSEEVAILTQLRVVGGATVEHVRVVHARRFASACVALLVNLKQEATKYAGSVSF